MRTSSILAWFLLLLLGVATAAWGEGQREPRAVTVTGDAEVRVVPDEVVFTLGVETWHKNLAAARSENEKRVKQLLAAAREHKVEPKHVQTDFISVDPTYHTRDGRSELTGYMIRKSVVLTLKEIARFEDLLTAALEGGANHVHGIQFRTTELRRYRDEARALAIRAAREKALALARTLQQSVGKPLTIREEPTGWWSWYGGWWGSRWGGGMAQNVVQNSGGAPPSSDSGIAPGQITVQARVTVTFELK